MTNRLIITIEIRINDSTLTKKVEIKSAFLDVKSTDPISSIFDLIESPDRLEKQKLMFKGQVLNPNLSFAFYKVHNNDTIDIVNKSDDDLKNEKNINSEKLIEKLWNAYENTLACIREMELQNKQLDDRAIIDMMRITFLNKEENTKISDRDECAKRLTILNKISDKIIEIDELLNNQVSDEQIEELNEFFKNTNRLLISFQRFQHPKEHSTS